MLLVLAAVAAASASSHSSVRSKFNEQGSQTLVGANATLGNATYGSGSSKHIFSVAGPGSDAGIVSLTAAGAAAADAFDPSQAEGDELYVMYTLDLQPPLGPHTYIGGVTVSFEFSGANTTAVLFGLRRDSPGGCCGDGGGLHGDMQAYCDGLYGKKLTPTTNSGTVQTFTLDRGTVAYVARNNATRGAAFQSSIMSPDGQMKLDIVLTLTGAAGGGKLARSTLKVTKVSYDYPPLWIEDGCNVVIPWSKNGHGSIGGQWLMFYAGNNMTLHGNGYLQERWEDECCFDPPAEARCEPTYELDQATTAFRYLGGGGGWIEGNYPPIGSTNKFYRLEGANGHAAGSVTITQRQCGGQYNLAYSPTDYGSLLPSATDPKAGISQLSPMATWDAEREEVTARVRAGRPFECGAGPHWNCGACMQHIRSGNCSDPTYPSGADLELNPTCMAQFNGTRASLGEPVNVTAQDSSEKVNLLQQKQRRSAVAIRAEIAALQAELASLIAL
jgi:hypothetical protein